LLQRRREGLQLIKAGTVLLDASRTADRPTAVLTAPASLPEAGPG
jgi:hypothetical protein